MGIDLLQSNATESTAGVMTITNRLYLNGTCANQYSSLSANTATVTVGASNAYIDVTTTLTPTSATTIAANESQRYVGDKTNANTAGVLP